MWLILTIKNKKIGLGVIYKTPQANVECLNEIADILETIYMDVDSVILMGDLNINLLIKNNTECRKFETMLLNYNMKQIVNFPTRITINSESLIDVICISDNIVSNFCDSFDLLNVTDHMLVFCDLAIEYEKPNFGKFYYRNFKYFNVDAFNNDAAVIDWNEINNLEDINSKVNCLSENILQLFDRHAPLTLIQPKRPYKPYITYTIKQMIKLKERAKRKYVKTKLEKDRHYYVDLKNYLSTAIRNEKNAFMNYELKRNKNNSKAIWNNLYSWGLCNKKVNTILEQTEFDVNELNNFFVNIAGGNSVNPNMVDFYKNNKMDNGNFLAFTEITNKDVNDALTTIKSNAMGTDGINLKMLKIVMPFCVDIITSIINESFRTGTFPEQWKNALVICCPKISDPVNMSDIRPLNILPAMSKIAEKLAAKQLKVYLETYTVIPSLQSGFREAHGTQTALLKVLNDVSEAMDNRMITFLILLDQSKAFDVVNFELLIAKLHYIGLNNTCVEWFKSYVHSRRQCVRVGDKTSDLLETKSGVPQGSILGPILFTIFTFDLPQSLTYSHYHLYADDVQLYMSVKADKAIECANQINTDLANFGQWCSDNALKINPSKSVVMCIGNEKLRKKVEDDNITITLNKEVINWADTAKVLGLYIDNNLTFESHVNKVISTSFMKLKNLKKFKYSFNSDTKLNLIKSLIYPHVDYCCNAYLHYLTQYNTLRLQRIQNASMRFVYCIPFREHVTPYFNNELKIVGRGNYLYCIFLKKLIDTKKPSYLYNILVKRSDVHNVNVRKDKYTVPQHNTSKFEGSFSYMAPTILNMILDMLSLPKQRFKENVKTMLLES